MGSMSRKSKRNILKSKAQKEGIKNVNKKISHAFRMLRDETPEQKAERLKAREEAIEKMKQEILDEIDKNSIETTEENKQ